jgi:hypothetical protein
MGTLNEFLPAQRVAVQALRQSAVEDPTARPMQASGEIVCTSPAGRSGPSMRIIVTPGIRRELPRRFPRR